MMSESDVETFYQRLAEAFPNAQTELHYRNPYTLLVAVVLSAQATDAAVNRVTDSLFETVDTPQKMLALGEERLRDQIRSLGYYNAKARHIIALSKALVERFGGNVPPDLDALTALPGVGRKTANVVLNVAFNKPTIAVDTHVFRVANRTGLAPGKTPLDVERKLLERTPERWLHQAHHLLILHGRYVCKSRRPLCEQCVVRDLCAYSAKSAE